MTDPLSPTPASPQPPPGGISLQSVLHIAYGLYALGFVTGGMGAIAAIVVAYLKRADAVGTIYASHFDWILRTFWWSLLWIVVSLIFTLLLIGWVGLFVTLVWVLYRIVKGWLALAENRTIGPAY
ncbi:MAG: hypothetical protein WC999_00015 [Hydrogenophaga sp.]